MNRLLFIAFVAIPFASGHAAKPCEELKAEIAAKLEAKGVKDYMLEITPNDQTGDKKVVGSCDGGTRKIVYSKGAATQPSADADK
jgi:hypothetical protein